MTHSFDFRIATVYGLPEAIIYNYFETRTVRCAAGIERRKSNTMEVWEGVCFSDGHYWVRASVADLFREHPYLHTQEIENAIEHLCSEDGGLLRVRSSRDGKLWYSIGKFDEIGGEV